MTPPRQSARAAALRLAILLAAALGGAARPQLPASLDEDWFMIRMGGSAVGTASERWTQAADELVFQAR